MGVPYLELPPILNSKIFREWKTPLSAHLQETVESCCYLIAPTNSNGVKLRCAQFTPLGQTWRDVKLLNGFQTAPVAVAAESLHFWDCRCRYGAAQGSGLEE